VILQNKIKKDHDFIYFSRLNAKLERLSQIKGVIDDAD
jgi:hypothetical protein